MNMIGISRKAWLILLAVFVIMVGYGVLMPILPFYTERLTAGRLSEGKVNFHIGLLTASYPLAQMLFVGYWGKLSDRVGRKPLILLGIAGFIVMQLLSGLATGLWMFFVARILGGILSSGLIPAANAYISDIFPENDRSKAFGLMGSAVSTGIIAGPFLSSFFANNNFHLRLNWFGHYQLDKYSVPFLMTGLAGVLILLAVACCLPAGSRKTTLNVTNLQFIKQLPVLKWLFAISLVTQLSVALFESSFSIYGKKMLGFSSLQLSYGFMICGVIMAIGQPLVTLIKPRMFSFNKQIISGLILSGAMLIILPFTGSIVLVWIVIGLFALGNTFVAPHLSATITKQDETNIGRNLGLQTTFNSVGQFIGPLAGSGLLVITYYSPFVFMGVALLAVGIGTFSFKWSFDQQVFRI